MKIEIGNLTQIMWLYLVVLICLQSLVSLASNLPTISRFKPGGKRLLLIGLYQMCLNSASENTTVFNHEARIAHAAAKSIFVTRNRDALNDLILRRFYFYEAIKDLDYTFADLQFETYDVCTEQDLAAVSVRMTLSPDFYMSTDASGNPPLWHEKPIKNWESETRVIALILCTKSTFVRRLNSFLYDTAFPIFVELSINDSTPLNIHTNSHRFLLAGKQAVNDVNVFMNYLKNSTVNHITIIYLNANPSSTHEAYYNTFLHVFTNSEEIRCYALEFLETELNGTLLEISKNMMLSTDPGVVLLFGQPEEQARLFHLAISNGVENHTWFLHEVTEKGVIDIPHSTRVYSFLTINTRLPRAKLIEERTTVYSVKTLSNNTDGDIQASDSLSNSQKTTLMIRSVDSLIRILADYVRVNVLSPYHLRDWAGFKLLFDSEIREKTSKMLARIRWEESKGKYKLFFKLEIVVRDAAKYCPKIVCPRGWIQTFGAKLKRFTPWSYSQGWTCKQCPTNFYKSYKGDGVCSPCPEYQFSRPDQSECFDPYLPTYLWFDLTSVKLFLIANTVCFLFCIFIMALFFIYQNTPVVITSDYRLSQIHLSSFLLTFAVLPVIYIGEPVKTLCQIKPVLISATTGVSLSIVVMKSHKMLMAYKSKVKLTRNDRKRSVRLQIVIILLMITIGQIINFITIIQHNPIVITQRRLYFENDDHNVNVDVDNVEVGKAVFRKFMYCNTSFHIHAQVVYFISLLIFALIRAFQGRKIPTILNDAMSIIYATFTVSIVYAIMFPIYFFQRNELDGAKVHWFCLLLSNFLFMVIFYGTKVNVILFHPGRNTKAYYRVMMMSNAKKMAHRSLQNTTRKRKQVKNVYFKP